LETAHVVCGLLDQVAEALTPFTIAKVEGDAVFCYAHDEIIDGQGTLELMSSAYEAFRAQTTLIEDAGGCPCPACGLVGTVGLKFVLHHGEFAMHRIAGHTELIGRDVIVVHRLLKNAVSDGTLRDYILATRPWTDRFGVDVDTLERGTATYDHVGTIEFTVRDLQANIAPHAIPSTRPTGSAGACSYVPSPIRRSAATNDYGQ